MGNWKQAFWLASFELRKSKISILSFLIFLTVGTFFFVELMHEYLENSFVMVDVFFLIVFGMGPFWLRAKEFQFQKIDETTWASPQFIMLSQLPIKKEALVGSRFITYFTYGFPLFILLLASLYFFSADLREVMSPTAYIVFSLIWLSYAVGFGGAFPASDVGDRVTILKSTISAIILIIALIVGLMLFDFFYEDGLVSWTIMLANEWPLLSSIVSIAVAILSIRSYINYAYKQMKKIDYLK